MLSLKPNISHMFFKKFGRDQIKQYFLNLRIEAEAEEQKRKEEEQRKLESLQTQT